MDIAGGEKFDVIVVGTGNAATCAALSARETGAEVLMLEVAPEEACGGNSCFTGGAFGVVYHGAADLVRLIPDMKETELRDVDFGTYTEEEYFDDMGRLTQYRCDPDLTEILIRRSFDSFEALADRLEGVDARRFLETVRAFNAAPRPEVPFNPNIRDGLATAGLAIDKTNWAQCLDQPPYEAYAVTTGITFTFGGLKVSNDTEVEDTTGRPIPGLWAAGEIVGGLYYHNYASGTGLMAGAVFGRLAGRNAAARAKGL
jgi:succinate dehydrogenase/fumarate reductase flavoprotein subunit